MSIRRSTIERIASRVGARVLRTWSRSCPQVRDSASDLSRRPGVDPLFELVDLVVECVDEIEEVFGDQIDDAVHDHAGAVVVPRSCES
jgi:hypothetical protein